MSGTPSYRGEPGPNFCGSQVPASSSPVTYESRVVARASGEPPSGAAVDDGVGEGGVVEAATVGPGDRDASVEADAKGDCRDEGEIMKSIERGNRVLGVHINSIKGRDQLTKSLGPSPFDNLGAEISQDGMKATPTEWKDGKWIYYTDLDPFTVSQQPVANRGLHLPLSHWLSVYDWVADNGYNSFSNWIS